MKITLTLKKDSDLAVRLVSTLELLFQHGHEIEVADSYNGFIRITVTKAEDGQ